nr:rutc family protein [Quercus suber]
MLLSSSFRTLRASSYHLHHHPHLAPATRLPLGHNNPIFLLRPSPARTMSTTIEPLNSKRAAQPVGPYSQAVRAGPHIFVSGQIPADASGTLVQGSIADKTKVCCEGLKSILEDSGSGIEKVVKVTVFLSSMDSFAEMNGVYETYFTHKPARSCVAVKELPKGVPVEIEAIALA